MRYSLLIIITLLGACSTTEPIAKSDKPSHYSDLQFAPMSYEAPDPLQYRIELSNGVPVYLYAQKDLPLINVNFSFKENNYPDALEKVAAVQLLSSMYRKGGTKTLSPDSVDEKLEFISAGVSGGLSDYSSSIQVDVVSKDVYQVLDLTKELFLNPGIDTKRLEQIKELYIQNIKHQYDRPGAVSQALYDHVLYGEHPINWDFDEDAVQKLTRKQLLEENKGRFELKNLVLGISGDFDRDTMVQYLEEYFKTWKPKARTIIPVKTPTVVAKPGIYIVDKDVSQAHIRMGQEFVQRPHPDYYSAAVASYILGSGGFTSRLVSRIRTDEGLAYTVRSYAGSSYDYQQSAGVGLQTKVATAAYAVQLSIEEIEKMISHGVTDEELKRAKDYFLQSIPSIFSTPENTIDFFVMSESNNRDYDHMKQYVEKINAITKEDVQRVIKKYFDPKKMAITIVGPKEELLKPDTEHSIRLSDIAPIIEIDIKDLLVKQ